MKRRIAAKIWTRVKESPGEFALVLSVCGMLIWIASTIVETGKSVVTLSAKMVEIESQLKDHYLATRRGGRSAKQNEDINNELRGIVTQYDALRAYVMLKHNTKTTPDGAAHLYYYSITHEAISPGSTARILQAQNIPESAYAPYLSALEKKMTVSIVTDGDCPGCDDTQRALRAEFARNGAGWVFLAPMFGPGDSPEILGILGVEFKDSVSMETQLPSFRAIMFSTATTLGAAISE